MSTAESVTDPQEIVNTVNASPIAGDTEQLPPDGLAAVANSTLALPRTPSVETHTSATEYSCPGCSAAAASVNATLVCDVNADSGTGAPVALLAMLHEKLASPADGAVARTMMGNKAFTAPMNGWIETAATSCTR